MGTESTVVDHAARHHGVFTRQTWLAAGLTDATLSRRTTGGIVQRLHPGVYCYASSPDTFQRQATAAAFACRDLAAASHVTAAYLWGMVSFGGRTPREVEVVTRRWRRIHQSMVVHESTDLVQADVTDLSGVPVTTPARTLVDMGTSARSLVGPALDAAIRKELTSIREVIAVLQRVARRGRNGVGVIRPHLEDHATVGTLTDSYLESLFQRGLAQRDVRLPLAQHRLRRGDGSIVCRLDFAYPELRLGIALDGLEFHTSRDQFQLDRSQQNEAELMGWTVLRYTWWDISGGMDRTARQVQQAIAARSANSA